MGRVARIDRGGTLRPPRETPQGFVRADAHLTRVGVLEYLDPSYPDGIRRELRTPEEVFAPAHLASFADAPVTDGHLPPLPNGDPQLVTAENARDFAVGHVAGTAREDGEHVAGELVFADAKVIKKLRADTREVSPGYTCIEDKTPGTHPVWGRYDLVQRDILVNHVALVPYARAGSTARVRMDAREGLPCAHANPVHTGDKMPDADDKTKLDAAKELLANTMKRAETAEADAVAQKARADAAEARADAACGRADAAEADAKALRASRTDASALAAKDAEIAALKTKLDEATQKLDGFDKRVADAVADRAKLERDAMPILGPSYRFDGVDDLEVMTATVAKASGFTMPKDTKLAYARARFDAEVERFKLCGDAIAAIGAHAQVRADAAAEDARTNLTLEQERAAMVARLRNPQAK